MGEASRAKTERRIARGSSELRDELQTQFRFLVRSARSYDDGDEAEAKNLAVLLRKFVHDPHPASRSRQVSLLEQLKVKNRLVFVDTAPRADLRNLMPQNGLAAQRFLENGGGARWIATLDLQPAERAGHQERFPSWWTDSIMVDGMRVLWNRKQLVLALSDQDGGAHVDSELDAKYFELSRLNGMGWRYHAPGAGPDDEGTPMLGNPVWAGVRQIAWELESTLRWQLWKELALPQGHPPVFRQPEPTNYTGVGIDEMASTSFRVDVSGGKTGRRVLFSWPADRPMSLHTRRQR
jgi:hypothetical protein